MKIKVNYDLLTKAKHSKEGVSANELFIKGISNKLCMPLFLYNIYNALYNLMNKKFMAPIITIVLYSFLYAVCYKYSKSFKEDYINKAEINLQRLVNQLTYIEVKTSVELLKESKLNQTNYKIEFVDGDKLPRLKQYKYIDIPLSNGYEETLLQEHVFGDEDYDLSVNSPVKKMSFKPVKNNI